MYLAIFLSVFRLFPLSLAALRSSHAPPGQSSSPDPLVLFVSALCDVFSRQLPT